MTLLPTVDGGFGVIYADPPWRYEVWSGETAVKARDGSKSTFVSAAVHYQTMARDEIAALPVGDISAANSALFLWVTWPLLIEGIDLMRAWGFEYKTCAFAWMKAHAGQIDLFADDLTASMGMGYWTRANSEVCLLGTRGNPKRKSAGVRQGIIEPRREHSRKPDCVHGRIEQLVDGPYCEMFGRKLRSGWTVWGNQTEKFNAKGE